MFKKFYPTIYVQNTYKIDFQKYYERGYRVIITDIDNTLVGHGAPCNERAYDLFCELKKIGYKTCLLSNNDENRVKPFADKVGSEYICDAHKPNPEGYLRAMEKCNGNLSNTFFIGDQLFTDIFGANKANIKSILVNPLEKDFIFYIKLKRLGEKIVMPFYERYARKNPRDL